MKETVRESKLASYAMQEFVYAGWTDGNGKWDNEMQKLICKQVIELLNIISNHEHLDAFALYAINLFKKLVYSEPISEIRCTEDEWFNYHDDMYQNKRLSSIFKEGKDGKPYYLDAIKWRSANRNCFYGNVEGIASRQYIRLPFIPKAFCIDIIEKDGIKKIKDRSQLKAVKKYYDMEE